MARIYTVAIDIRYIDYELDGEYHIWKEILDITTKEDRAREKWGSYCLEDFFSNVDIEYQSATISLNTLVTNSKGDFFTEKIQGRSLI